MRGGLQTVVIAGDSQAAGLYTMMVRLPSHTRIPPHSHPDERSCFVLAGTWYFAYGDRYDEASLKPLSPGSFYTEPPDVAHFAMTKEEVILQITGTGPSSTAYVDPANDPARR